MAWIITLGWLLAFQAHLSYQISKPEDKEYVAAVVEFAPRVYSGNGSQTVNENALRYLQYIEKARKANADIIVFPEDGLTSVSFPGLAEMDHWTTFIPDPSQNSTPCTEDNLEMSSALKNISCAAKENRIYVVINIAEKAKRCINEKCSKQETIYHNTNVVFDRTGKVIARYRKVNLFDEEQFSVAAVPEVVTFETDFGVKFGTFICFDILFHVPALNLTRQHGVTDIVYSTAWFSEIPFLTADQTQFGWAYSENVNLLAAGYNRPKSSTTGSGIYLGRKGIARAIYAREEGDQLLIERVPKIGKQSVTDDEKTKTMSDVDPNGEEINETWADIDFHFQDNITRFTSMIVDGQIHKELCHDSFCCTFKVDISTVDPKVKYRIAVFNGRRLYGRHVEAAVEVCGLIQCANDSLESCPSSKRSKTIFSEIKISSTFHEYQTNLVMPSTLNSSILPITSFSYDQFAHDDHVHIEMVLSEPTKDIVTFGLYGRIISKDGEDSAGTANLPSFPLIFSLALGLILALRSRV